MTTAIKLDHKFCTKTVEVSNIIINAFLPLKANGIIL